MTLQLSILTSLISRNAGGLFNSVRRLGQCLESECGIQTNVFGVEDEQTATDLSAWKPLSPQVFSRIGPKSLQFAPGLFPALLAAKSDLVHVHGIWTYASVACNRWGGKTGKPHVISPRGMLDPWALQNSSWKKKIALFFFEGKHLGRASCLHALCRSEADSMRDFGLKSPICVVPNGVDLPPDSLPHQNHDATENRNLLFLGRIHPKKGIVKALEAWRELKRIKTPFRWRFLIAGWDQAGHTEQLQELCRNMGLKSRGISASEWLDRHHQGNTEDEVVFLGPTFGAEKDKLLRSAQAFILPSYSEGLPMAVLEAWAYRLPVIMTDECNLPEGFAASAAIRVIHESSSGASAGASSIVDGLSTLTDMNDVERSEMGSRGRQLVEDRFTWPRISHQMNEMYDWVVGGGAPPATVER